MSYEFQNMEELNNNIESTNQDVSQEILDGTKEMRAMTGGQAGAIAYGIHRISELPAVNEKIQDCKEAFNDAMENAKDTISEFSGLKDTEIKKIRKNAADIAEKALWKHFIKFYYEAYDIALRNAQKRLLNR